MCSVKGCEHKDVVGAHVWIHLMKNPYILPLCNEHNHSSNTSWMWLKTGVMALEITSKVDGGDVKYQQPQQPLVFHESIGSILGPQIVPLF